MVRKPLVPVKDNAKEGELKGVSKSLTRIELEASTLCDMYFKQVNLYIAEHRQELEDEVGKDKVQVTRPL